MKAKLNFFLLLVALITCAGCSSYIDELVSEDEGILSRAVSSEYYISGADELYTGLPETYTLSPKNGTSLNGVYVTEWKYSSDLYRVSFNNISITLGRKLALGEYTLTAILSNGESVSKQITAIDSSGSSTESIEKQVTIIPVGVSKDGKEPFEDINNYRFATGKSFGLDAGEGFFLRCNVNNTSSSSVQVSPSSISFAYGSSNKIYAPKSVIYDGSSTVYIQSNSSVTVTFYLGGEWSQNLLPNNATIIKPYYNQTAIQGTGYAYRLLK